MVHVITIYLQTNKKEKNIILTRETNYGASKTKWKKKKKKLSQLLTNISQSTQILTNNSQLSLV